MSELKEAKPKTIKLPGPDHPITIAPNANRIVVKIAGRILQHSGRRRALDQCRLDLRGALRCGRRDQGPRRVLSRPRRRDQLTDAGGLASVPRAGPHGTKLPRVPATTHAVAGTLPAY